MHQTENLYIEKCLKKNFSMIRVIYKNAKDRMTTRRRNIVSTIVSSVKVVSSRFSTKKSSKNTAKKSSYRWRLYRKK